MTLYVAIIGLGTLAGILFNVLINKRLIFKILGIVITLITGTFACCVVLFPYFFFESYNSLFLKLSITAALLIVIYVSARMIANAVSSNKNRDTAAEHKEARKIESAEEIVVADHALKNRVKSIISADKSPAKSLTQRVSVNFDNTAKYASGKETKEYTAGQSVLESKAVAYDSQSVNHSFGQALKDADAKILSETKAYIESGKPAVGDAFEPDKQGAAGLQSVSGQPAKDTVVSKQEDTAAAEQSLFEYESGAVGSGPVKETKKPEKITVSDSVLGIQYEEAEVKAVDETANEPSGDISNITAEPEMQTEQPAVEAVVLQDVEEPVVLETQSEPAITEAEQADTAVVAVMPEIEKEAEEVQTEVTEPAAVMPEAKADVTERTEEHADAEKQPDTGSSKFATIITKSCELMDEGKYVYAAELLQICADHSDDTAQQKQADILIIECLASSNQKTEAQKKWLEFLNKKYILDEADKTKLKKIMSSL